MLVKRWSSRVPERCPVFLGKKDQDRLVSILMKWDPTQGVTGRISPWGQNRLVTIGACPGLQTHSTDSFTLVMLLYIQQYKICISIFRSYIYRENSITRETRLVQHRSTKFSAIFLYKLKFGMKISQTTIKF